MTSMPLNTRTIESAEVTSTLVGSLGENCMIKFEELSHQPTKININGTSCVNKKEDKT